jgi:hypothetical protein
VKGKVKLLLLSGRGDSYGLEWLRLPHFLDNRLTDCSEVVSLTHRPQFTPENFLVLISVRDWVERMAIVWPKELCQWQNPGSLRQLNPLNRAPQPTTLPRTFCLFQNVPFIILAKFDEPTTLWLVAQFLNELRYLVPPVYSRTSLS